MLDEAIKCDYFQIPVLMNCVECETQTNYGVSAAKFHIRSSFSFLKLTTLNWSPWLAIHACSRDRKLTTDAQRHTTSDRPCSTLVIVKF